MPIYEKSTKELMHDFTAHKGRVPQRGVGAVGNWLGVATAESLA